jgi:hypothetical protein
MIWYRHWLEIRYTLVVTIVLAFGMGGLFASQIGEGPLSRELVGSRIAASLDRQSLLAWAAYVNRVGLSAWMIAVFLGSTGLRSLFHPTGSPAFTLTLPVSRRRIIATRLGVTLGLSLSLEAVWLMSHLTVLALRGGDAPYGPLLQSFALAIPVVVTWVSVAAALMTFLSPGWAFLAAIVLAIAGAIPAQIMVTAWPLRGEMPWLVLGGLLASGGVAIGVTLRFGPSQEFA